MRLIDEGAVFGCMLGSTNCQSYFEVRQEFPREKEMHMICQVLMIYE